MNIAEQPDDIFTAVFDLAYKHLTGRDPHTLAGYSATLDYQLHREHAWHGWQLAAGAGDSGAWRAWYEAAMVASNAAGYVGFDPAQTIAALDAEVTKLRRQVTETLIMLRSKL